MQTRWKGQFCFLLALSSRLCAFLNKGIFDSKLCSNIGVVTTRSLANGKRFDYDNDSDNDNDNDNENVSCNTRSYVGYTLTLSKTLTTLYLLF